MFLKKLNKVLIGYGGHAREIMVQMNITLPCYVDDEFVDENTLPISKLNFEKCEVIVAIGDPLSRKKMVDKLPSYTKYFTFIHPTAQIMDDNIIQYVDNSILEVRTDEIVNSVDVSFGYGKDVIFECNNLSNNDTSFYTYWEIFIDETYINENIKINENNIT